MTQVSGKIYQIKNAAGTENRFPRTVIEAVYGLSSYLQQQFASLADIYMPIEGISEALTGQEFVYRKTPNTIKAKSLTLDKILGKTLAWNQLIPGKATGTHNGVTFTNNGDGSYTLSGTAGSSEAAEFYILNSSSVVVPSGHKALFVISGNSNATLVAYNSTYSPINISSTSIITVSTVEIYRVSIKVNAGTQASGRIWASMYDLTLLYGSEIGGMTDAEILAKFESEFPGYHEYSAGKLISNDASALETTGFNKWDEEWEAGIYSIVTGQKTSYGDYIRCKNFIPVLPNTEYYKKAGAGSADFTLLYYDANKNFLSSRQQAVSESFTTPAGCSYLTFYINPVTPKSYSHDICINLSDASRNGQYEPYWKRTLPLNLNNIRVKDGQGNVITITGGLKSAGSVYDEIVGNKYVKRVGSVFVKDLQWDVNNNVFGTAISGIRPWSGSPMPLGNNMLSDVYIPTQVTLWTNMGDREFGCSGASTFRIKDNRYSTVDAFLASNQNSEIFYELATPVEYELVEPIVPTVKAGTTEARISPNADGLSAPFRADMTYSAQENNDSASSQYAAVAGRLLNPQTIWGQTFDGSSPVTGALTGVTSINSKLIFSGTGIGIAGNATISGGLSVSGTTAFDDDVYLSAHGLYLDDAEENSIWYDETNDRVSFGFNSVAYFMSGIRSDSFITAGASASASDARLKDNLTAIPQERALSILSAISGKEWDWNDKMTAFEGQHCSGLVAQEVQKVMPWAVLDYNDTLSLNYNCLWGIAIPVIQNLMHRVEELESKLNN